MGFADCKETAIRVSGEIPESEIYYGLYVPTTPTKTWDTRWVKPWLDPVFTHFWVQTEDKIIDHAAEQFGGPEVVETTTNDPHYVVVGKYDKEKDQTNPIVEYPLIEWGSLINGDTRSVRVVWPEYERYMMKFK